MQIKQKTEMIGQFKFKLAKLTGFILIATFSLGATHAAVEKSKSSKSSKNPLSGLLAPKSNEDFNKAQVGVLSDFNVIRSNGDALPVITKGNGISTSTQIDNAVITTSSSTSKQIPLSFDQTILTALLRSPVVSQSIASLSSQNSSIDVAKAGYYPQLSGGVSSNDLTGGNGNGQMLSLNATQMLYDFGKTKSSVNVEEAKLFAAQADVLVKIDQVAYETAVAIINFKRFQSIVKIAQQQVDGISRISEITKLRAKAGISTQADPTQAKSNLEAAETNLVIQESQLKQNQQKLKTLTGMDIKDLPFPIPTDLLVKGSNLYDEPQFNKMPNMMAAQAEVDIAQLQKQQTKISNYPTLNIRGSLSQAVGGRNPNNNKDDGTDSSIMLEATSTFYQGGATSSRTKAASFAEEAAKARVNSIYLNVLDELRQIQEEIENTEQQLVILNKRKETTIRTKELYQEQYKLGTRSAVDLLNAEQSIHSVAQEIENAKYDIYAALVRHASITGRSFELYKLNNISIQGFEVQP